MHLGNGEIVLRLGVTVALCAALGLERELRGHPAGLRTHALVGVGAALFSLAGAYGFGGAGGDSPTRVAAQVATGIGFIGAGTILRGERGVIGLTTAATIWLSAALGLGIGGGEYILSLVATALILAVLWVFPYFEKWIDRSRHMHVYQVTICCGGEAYARLAAAFHQSGLRVITAKRTKNADTMICTWTTVGSPKMHEVLVEAMLYDPAILKLEY